MQKKLNIDLYKKVYLIRAAEEKIIKHYPEDDMKTPVHLSLGQEAISAGVCHSVGKSDQIFGFYRSHGVYLSLTLETDKFFAEMYGKETGIAKGKAGSMHLSSVEHNFLGSSAVVATIIPVAVGAALANKMSKNNNFVFVFVGDGAVDEGVFWESINFACLKNLPVLFVYEDNNYAIHSPASDRHSYKSILEIVEKFGCNIFEENTTDPEKIYNIALDAVKKSKENNMPSFLSLKYYRYLEHVGIYPDFKFGYRSEEEYKKWLEIDPVKVQRAKLLKLYCNEIEVSEIEKSIDDQIEKSYQYAKKSNFAPVSELYEDVFA